MMTIGYNRTGPTWEITNAQAEAASKLAKGLPRKIKK